MNNINISSDPYKEPCFSTLETQLNQLVGNVKRDCDTSLNTLLGPLFEQCRKNMINVQYAHPRDIPSNLDALGYTVLRIQNVLTQAGFHDALEAKTIELRSIISDLRNNLSNTAKTKEPNAHVILDPGHLTAIRRIEAEFCNLVDDSRLIANVASENILNSMIESAHHRAETAINNPKQYLDILQQHIRAFKELVRDDDGANVLQQEFTQLNAKIDALRKQLHQPAYLPDCAIHPQEDSVYFAQPQPATEEAQSVAEDNLADLIKEDYVKQAESTARSDLEIQAGYDHVEKPRSRSNSSVGSEGQLWKLPGANRALIVEGYIKKPESGRVRSDSTGSDSDFAFV